MKIRQMATLFDIDFIIASHSFTHVQVMNEMIGKCLYVALMNDSTALIAIMLSEILII
jgi:hypothetical protein